MPYISSQRRVYIGVFIVLALLIGLHYIGWLKLLENFFYRLIVPASTEVHSLSVKVGNQYQFFTNKKDFLDKYTSCSLEVSKGYVLETQNKILENENAELKKQLNFVQGQKTPTILANVVGREIAGAEKAIIINAGSRSGIKVGQPVINGAGIVVGKIVRVEDVIAIVRLINDPTSKIEVSIINTDHSIGVIEGGYDITLKMKFVPRNEVVKVDDEIITSGYEPLIPRGLLLGKVAEVQNEANQGFQDISAVPLVDLSKLTQVTVLLTH